MRFEIRKSYYPFSNDPCELIQPMEVDVIAVPDDEDSDDDVLAARVAVDRLKFRGISDIDMAYACDARSEDWAELWATLFRGEDIDPDIAGDQILEEIAFILDAVIHPRLLPHRVDLLHGVLRIFSSRCLGVISKAGRGLWDLSPSERRAIGGCQIFHPELLTKPCGILPNFDTTPNEIESVTLPLDAKDWVESHWREG